MLNWDCQLANFVLEISFKIVFFFSFCTKFIIKIVSVCDIWGPELILKWDNFCFTIWQVIFFTINPSHFGGGCELCGLSYLGLNLYEMLFNFVN